MRGTQNKGATNIEPPHPAYKIEGPALVSFSGGRTSGYMLHEIIRAHGGALPPDVHVCFANTGKEREETLRFVHECGTRWGVKVHWLEWRSEGFEEVGYNSASRSGEPFEQLIAKKRFTPNAVARFCTIELKIRVMKKFARAQEWDYWVNIIGLRYDEGHRVLKALANNDKNKERFKVAMPMSKARATKATVMSFWAAQPFDLGLRDYEGNCDLCFLKSRGKKVAIIRERPGSADWWIKQETVTNVPFVTEYGYGDLVEHVRCQPLLPFEDDEHDAECGLLCQE